MSCAILLADLATVSAVVSSFAALLAVVVAVGIPYVSYRRRPQLGLLKRDAEGRVEGDGLPYVRLLVTNAKRHRAAYETRVEVIGYREKGARVPLTTLGTPPLGWTSQPDRAMTVYADAHRPIDFGILDRGPVAFGLDPGDDRCWQMRLALKDLHIRDRREWLQPGHVWSVRLLIGARDGDAAPYDVDVSWDGDAVDAQAALDSVRVEIRDLRRGVRGESAVVG